MPEEPVADETRSDTPVPGTNDDDPRFEEIQEEIDEIRRRLPHNPGLGIPDPDVRPAIPPENGDEPDPPG